MKTNWGVTLGKAFAVIPMGYIRTEDGKIYQLADTSGPNRYGEYHYYKHAGCHAYTKEVVKQAKTVEELCDGFYIDDGTYGICPGALFSKEEYKDFLSTIEDHKKFNIGFTAYGIIKTKNGLSYVTEMTSEGGWKLL